jgi:hypothetical protein
MWPLFHAGMALGADSDHAFYASWVSLSLLFTVGTQVLLALLLQTLLGRLYPHLPDARQAMLVGLGVGQFVLSPPILFLVKYPVHGAPNDLLGYCLMLAALLCLARRRIAWFSGVSIAAAFCRETTLLIPFVFLFFDPLPLHRKLLPALLPVAALALLRILWPGPYDALSGWRVNASVPAETLGFLLLTFGPLWILGTLGYATLRNIPAAQDDPFLRMFIDSFPWSMLLTLGVTTAFAYLREIRIVYIMFLYFVPFSVIALYQHRAGIGMLARHKYYIGFFLAALLASIRFYFWMHPLTRSEVFDRAAMFNLLYLGYRNTPQYNWINIFVVCLFLSVICLPVMAVAWRPSGWRSRENPEGSRMDAPTNSRGA